jgi:hypothetical protein
MSSPQPWQASDRVIAARLTHIHVVRPLKAGPTGGLAATEPDRSADGRSGPDSVELLATSFGARPVHPDASARATVPSASAKLVSVVDPDDSSDDSHPERPAGPLARSRPLPVSTKRRREGRRARDARRGSHPVNRSGPGETCGGYSGCSGNTATDNVSSPQQKPLGGYGEDTLIRAGDNGGSARAPELHEQSRHVIRSPGSTPSCVEPSTDNSAVGCSNSEGGNTWSRDRLRGGPHLPPAQLSLASRYRPPVSPGTAAEGSPDIRTSRPTRPGTIVR